MTDCENPGRLNSAHKWFQLYFPAVFGFGGIVYVYLVFFDIITATTRTHLLLIVTLGAMLGVLSLHRGSEYRADEFMVSDSFQYEPWAFALGIVLFMLSIFSESVAIALVGGLVLVATAASTVRETENKSSQ